jgi:hypothetical protein
MRKKARSFDPLADLQLPLLHLVLLADRLPQLGKPPWRTVTTKPGGLVESPP